MVYGQKPKYRKQWMFLQQSALTYSVDHTVLESRVNVQRLSPCRVLIRRIRVEIPNNQYNRSTAQANGVGENPLNGKGITAAF